MHRILRQLLPDATGRSELVIVAFFDIRGFSNFNETVESVESALYVKRVYMRVLDEYFPGATFFKPTGDGLMVLWCLDETDVLITAKKVLHASLQLVNDFPGLCADDPVINFPVPTRAGVGLARGAACRLGTGDQILDYSGRLLNQTARLMDLARPEGVVVHGNYGVERLADDVAAEFEPTPVFVKGIAESKPLLVHIQKGKVAIPPRNLKPLTDAEWIDKRWPLEHTTLQKLGRYTVELPEVPASLAEVRVAIEHDHMVANEEFTHRHVAVGSEPWHKFEDRGGKCWISLDCERVSAALSDCEILRNEVFVNVGYYRAD